MAIESPQINLQGAPLTAPSLTNLFDYEMLTADCELKGYKLRIGVVRSAATVFALYINGATNAANDLTIAAGQQSATKVLDIDLSIGDMIGVRLKTLTSGEVAHPINGFLNIDDPSAGTGGGSLTVKEVDGNPSFTATTIRFPNGSLTNDGDGVATVNTTGPQGPAGATGPQGPTGATGATGPAGTNGIFTAIASQTEAEAGTENTKGMTSLRTKQAIAALGGFGVSSYAQADLPSSVATGTVARVTDSLRGLWRKVTTSASSWIPLLDELNVRDFGAVGDGINDDTASIQSAIDTCYIRKIGRLFFPAGVYLVNGALQGTDRPSVLRFPATPSASWRNLELCGTTTPHSMFGTIGNIIFPQAGAIIKSTGSGGAIIGSDPFSLNGGTYPNPSTLTIKNLTFQTTDAPPRKGVDGFYFGQIIAEQVQIDTGVYNVNALEPTNSGAVGLVTPGLNNAAFSYLKNVVVSGYYTGIEVHEHTVGDNVVAASCKYGVDLKTASHASIFTRLGLYRNQNNIKVSGVHPFKILQANIEQVGAGQFTSSTAWQQRIFDLDDSSNLGVGEIEWNTVIGGEPSFGSSFVKNGGANVITKQIGSSGSSLATLAGDVTGANSTTTVEKIRNIPVYIPASTPSQDNDNFNDGARDAKWDLLSSLGLGFTDPAVTVIEDGNGRLAITGVNTNSSNFNGYQWKTAQDYTDKYIQAELVQAPTGSGANATFLEFVLDGNNLMRFQVNYDSLIGQIALFAYNFVNGNVGTQTKAAYSGISHRFLRIRLSAVDNKVFFETSPDATSFSEFANQSLPFATTSLKPRIMMGGQGTQTILWDNFKTNRGESNALSTDRFLKFIASTGRIELS